MAGWWRCLTPVVWRRTSWRAQRARKSVLRVDSSPIRAVRSWSKGFRPAVGVQQGHGVVRGVVPVVPEGVGTGVEVDEPGVVGRLRRGVVERCEQGPAECVARQDVRAAVDDGCRGVGHRVEEALDIGPHALRGRRFTTSARTGSGGAGQVVEVGPFGVVQPQGAGERVQDGVGHPGEVASFQAGVVLDAAPASCAASARRSPGTRRAP